MSNIILYKNVLIVGASRGIGLAWVKKFLKLNRTRQADKTLYNIYATIRSESNQNLLDVQTPQLKILTHFDMGEENCYKKLQNLPNFNFIVINAGIMKTDTLETVKYKDFMDQFNVNSVGPVRILHGLFDNFIKKPSNCQTRILITSSVAGSHKLLEKAPIDTRRNYAYRMSKSALNTAGQLLA